MPNSAQFTTDVVTFPGPRLCAPVVPLMTRRQPTACAWQMTCISCTFCLFFFFFLGIDLENIVYYKDDTHYFVMTAKKQSLLEKGVILHVSAQRNSHFAFLLQININFMHKLERSGTCFFRPFVFIFPSFCFPNGLTKPESSGTDR